MMINRKKEYQKQQEARRKNRSVKERKVSVSNTTAEVVIGSIITDGIFTIRVEKINKSDGKTVSYSGVKIAKTGEVYKRNAQYTISHESAVIRSIDPR